MEIQVLDPYGHLYNMSKHIKHNVYDIHAEFEPEPMMDEDRLARAKIIGLLHELDRNEMLLNL